jgi:hypothetical protein
MRAKFNPKKYAGIEIEVNQKLLSAGSGKAWPKLRHCLATTICEVIGAMSK